MKLLPFFNKPARLYNNGKRAFIVVDLNDDDPCRGDSHGYIGMARHIAAKTGGEYLQLDRDTLHMMYPRHDYPKDDHGHQLRLLELFKERGCPDFFFGIHIREMVRDYLDQNGRGIHITSYNEYIKPSLWTKLKYLRHPLVPHHLTRQKLAYEGHHFAETFQEMPRPFIGVVVISGQCPEEYFKELRNAYDQATIFLCSAWRTPNYHFQQVEKDFRKCFNGVAGRFPVIAHNYSRDQEFLDRNETWNVYPGLLDQADHVFLLGNSESIAAEILATGKSFYQSPLYKKSLSHVRTVDDLKPGQPLKTRHFRPLDISNSIASSMIAAQQEQAASGGFATIADKIRGKAPQTRRGYKRV